MTTLFDLNFSPNSKVYRQPSKRRCRKPLEKTNNPHPTIYRATIISDWISYTLKYSDENGLICVSLPHFIGYIDETKTFSTDFELSLTNYGWTQIGQDTLLTYLQSPKNWKNFLTINSITGHIS